MLFFFIVKQVLLIKSTNIKQKARRNLFHLHISANFNIYISQGRFQCMYSASFQHYISVKAIIFINLKKSHHKVDFRSLLLLADIDKMPKPDEWSQNKRYSFRESCFFMEQSSSFFNLFSSISGNFQVLLHSDLIMVFSFVIIDSISATGWKYISDTRT